MLCEYLTVSLSCSFFPPPSVRYLLRNNVSPDLCNEDGLTALHQVRCHPPFMSVFDFYLTFVSEGIETPFKPKKKQSENSF